MSNFIHNIKSKFSHSHKNAGAAQTSGTTAANTEANSQPSSNSGEPTFSILPHPAKTNDPADLQPSTGGGLKSGGPMEAFHARDPYVPSEEIKKNLPAPLSHEELQARQAALASDMPGHGTQQGGLM